jgi:hypothetical protein
MKGKSVQCANFSANHILFDGGLVQNGPSQLIRAEYVYIRPVIKESEKYRKRAKQCKLSMERECAGFKWWRDF